MYAWPLTQWYYILSTYNIIRSSWNARDLTFLFIFKFQILDCIICLKWTKQILLDVLNFIHRLFKSSCCVYFHRQIIRIFSTLITRLNLLFFSYSMLNDIHKTPIDWFDCIVSYIFSRCCSSWISVRVRFEFANWFLFVTYFLKQLEIFHRFLCKSDENFRITAMVENNSTLVAQSDFPFCDNELQSFHHV